MLTVEVSSEGAQLSDRFEPMSRRHLLLFQLLILHCNMWRRMTVQAEVYFLNREHDSSVLIEICLF